VVPAHLLALALMALDCLVRAWRIQLSVWTVGGYLSFGSALRLNMYGEAASTLTPNRLGGEPARFLGLTEVHFVYAEGLSMGPDAEQKAIASAYEQIEEAVAA
jgi:uncharacterized membrane protein YbhN (UPF0104 family)